MSAYYAGLRATMVLAPSGQVLEYYIVRDGLRRVDHALHPTTQQVRAFEIRCASEGVPISRIIREDATEKEFAL